MSILFLGLTAWSLAEPRLTVVVMDPLCNRLACACVKGYAQRDYEALGRFLSSKLHEPVKIVYAEDLARAVEAPSTGKVDLIIGKASVVKFDAAECGMPVRPIASLTGQDGSTTLTGLFVVRKSDRAKTLSDLSGRQIFFGSPDADEKNRGAFEALRRVGIAVPKKVKTFEGCSDAALAVLESKAKPAPAAVISSYAAALIEGCGTVPKGALRIVGMTASFPFVTAYATANVNPALTTNIERALVDMRLDSKLLKVMESKRGFVLPTPVGKKVSADWPGWRGANRDGSVPWLPRLLPPRPTLVWSQPLTNSGLAGVSVSNGFLVVADRTGQGDADVFRCFRADDGKPIWKVVDRSPGHLDYGTSARATPTLDRGLAFVLGAFGHLLCVDLATGRTVWSHDLVKEFGGIRPNWGYTSSPLVVDDEVIVNPGAVTASLVALNRLTGAVLWKTPGNPSAYASFTLARLGGRNQVVGYDSLSLGGWDPATGSRLWTLVAPNYGDFNVPSASIWGGQLIVATENNGTRLYGFAAGGSIVPKPIASFPELAPDTVSPIVVGKRLVGSWGELYCLELAHGLRVAWTISEPACQEYCAFFSSGDRLLISTFRGELVLVDCSGAKPVVIGRSRVFNGQVGSYAYPAMVGSRLYVRESDRISCFDLEPAK
ncbi:MAG: PQQ-binding-like beta-propeller repeat protein [Fimbriimonas sp.]|nr:PQQ-binding-like beta-propeller repeat protein [Fimbriimonas sp.]